MAYNPQQKRYFARAIALTGGNLSAASKHLRENYESMQTVSDTTLRRFLSEPDAGEMVAEEGKLLTEAASQVAAEVERERIRREITGSDLERLSRDEKIFEEITGLFVEQLKTPEARTDPRMFAMYERLMKIQDARRARQMPAIGTSEEAQSLLISIAEAALAMLGDGKAAELMKDGRERYARKRAARLVAESNSAEVAPA